MVHAHIVDLDKVRCTREWERTADEIKQRLAAHIIRTYERVHGQLPQTEGEYLQALQKVSEWFLSAEGEAVLEQLLKDPNEEVARAVEVFTAVLRHAGAKTSVGGSR
jgi:hypothetical protein